MVDLIDIVLEGIKGVVEWVIGLFTDGLKTGYETLAEEMFGTPTPQTDGAFVLGEPLNAPWSEIQDALVGGEIMLLALLLLVMSVQGRHTVRIFNVGSAYEARKTKKTAWVGAILIIIWYWLSVLVLYLVDGFSIALLPDLSTVAEVMRGFLSVSLTNPGLALLFALIGGIAMWTLEALFYIREILLYVYLYGMPIAIALAYGNVPVLSDIATGFGKRFVPLAVLPLPAAVVLKGYDLLYAGGALSPDTPFLQYLVAASLPIVSLYVTWKTFKYATPLTAKVIGGATKGAALIGGVAAGAYVAGPSVATTAARWGPKAAAGQAVAQKAGGRGGGGDAGNEAPSYRRTENDPAGSTANTSSSDKRGMEFDRGIQ
jgi:type IV secretion system protein TrbL